MQEIKLIFFSLEDLSFDLKDQLSLNLKLSIEKLRKTINFLYLKKKQRRSIFFCRDVSINNQHHQAREETFFTICI